MSLASSRKGDRRARAKAVKSRVGARGIFGPARLLA